jgi:hypothetical protein
LGSLKGLKEYLDLSRTSKECSDPKGMFGPLKDFKGMFRPLKDVKGMCVPLKGLKRIFGPLKDLKGMFTPLKDHNWILGSLKGLKEYLDLSRTSKECLESFFFFKVLFLILRNGVWFSILTLISSLCCKINYKNLQKLTSLKNKLKTQIVGIFAIFFFFLPLCLDVNMLLYF